MMKFLVVGAGLAGCSAALELAENGVSVTLIDTADSIGGKVRSYGCKATEKCNNCGLCLATGLWEKVELHKNINIQLNTRLVDLIHENEKYTAVFDKRTADFDKVIIAIGYEPSFSDKSGLISGYQLEAMLANRTSSGFFEQPPESVAFIQCHGSRNMHEHTMYCSRVCCGYSTRAAKVIKHFYPDCRVVFFYMEMQQVAQGDYYQSLVDLGIEFVKCRPVEYDAKSVIYDDPSTGERKEKNFDLIVLSDGIKSNTQSGHISEIVGLRQDEAGFLQQVNNPDILVIGCASGPKNIAETYAESVAAAKEALI